MPSKKSSTSTATERRLRKPYPDFPLTPHPTGYWVKKIKGKQHRFGERWSSPEDALNEFMDVRDELYAGRPIVRGELTLADALNEFLDDRKSKFDSGEIEKCTFDDYRRSCRRAVESLGRKTAVSALRPQDFASFRRALTDELGPTAVGKHIQNIRTCFTWLYEAEVIEVVPRYGPNFKKPRANLVRQERASRPPREFSAKEIRDLLDAAGTNMRAMILLGVNCGYGNRDCATLLEEKVDLKNAWVEHPRPKTGVMRSCKLWPETCDALRDVYHEKPGVKDPEDDGLVFITKRGYQYDRKEYSSIAQEFAKLQDTCGCRRKGVGFYALRHVFETIGGDCEDQVAVDYIMGHAKNDMASNYRTQVFARRIEKVTDHIHQWLFGEETP